MSSKIIIPGGVADWLIREHRFADFVVGEKHTVFEWCKIYADENPNSIPPDFLEATTERRKDRLTFLGTNWTNASGLRPHPTETRRGVLDDPVSFRIMNAVYRELAKGIKSELIEIEKPVYLDDWPEKLDLTLCVIDAAPVLAIARRRKDHGKAIAELLAARDQKTQCEEARAAQANHAAGGTSEGLRPASDYRVHAAIDNVYDEAERTSKKPPNVKEVRKPVQQLLQQEGYTVSGNRIMQLAEQHNRRWKPGRTLAREKKKADSAK
jgi:hypothetical protein